MRLLFLLFLVSVTSLQAQIWQPEPYYIRTVEWNVDQVNPLPVFALGSPIVLEFDDISASEEDYYYKITHYNHDWTPSILTKNDYLIGTDNQRIIDYENSLTTLQSYSHYRLAIPNAFTKGITASGNYMMSIYDDDDELVFQRPFMVFEPGTQVGVTVKRARDLKLINTSQRVQFFIDTDRFVFQNVNRALHTVIYQNGDMYSPLRGLKPQYNLANRQIYNYDQEAAFYAGNEFLAFETRDYRAPTAQVNRVNLEEDGLYHAYLFTDVPRYDRGYTFNPDINGNFAITTLTNEQVHRQAEYIWVHFSIVSPELPQGEEMHIYGNWNGYNLSDDSRMTYDKKLGMYTNQLLLKQGFFNYRYVIKTEDAVLPGAISGNYSNTENAYAVLAYYREPGGRADRLIGYGTASSNVITN